MASDVGVAFLKQVLPSGDGDWHCLIGLDIEGGSRTNLRQPRHLFSQSWEDLEANAKTLIDEGYNVYFACSSYASDLNRTAKNASRAKSFWMDLDVGDSPTKFPNKNAAVDELIKFCGSVGLPTPTLVDSGGGLHIYWVLEEAIDSKTWAATANKLKTLCKTHDFKADPVVTSDVARILRLPGTLNYKTDPAGSVYIISDSVPVPFSKIEEALGSVETSPEWSEDRPARSPDESFDFKKILRRTKSGDGCGQLLWLLENPEKATEPLWRAGLSIAVNCEGPEKWVQALSQGHPGYDESGAQEKADKTYEFPHSCKFFDDNNPGICKSCTHFNKGTGHPGGPLRLGLVIKEVSYTNGEIKDGSGLFIQDEVFEAPLEEEDEALLTEEPTGFQSGDHLEPNLEVCTVSHTTLNPKIPEPYYLSSSGRLFRRTANADDDDILINNTAIYVLGHVVDPEKGRSLRLRFYEATGGEPTEILFETKHLGSVDKFRPQALNVGLNCIEENEVRILLREWWRKLQNTQEGKEIVRKQLGWADFNHSGFIVGDSELIGNGKALHSPYDPKLDTIVENTQPKGDLELWKKVIEPYSRPHFEPYAFAFLSAFGSVLLSPATAQQGLLISLISSSSGTGKSTILRCINSVFGHPELMMSHAGDTFAAMKDKLGQHNSISFTLDEITNMRKHQMSDLVYDISLGRASDRLQSQVNALRKNHARWRTICVSTANASLIERVQSNKSHADGENMRVMEYNIDPSEHTALDLQEARDLYDTLLYENYGMAGRIFTDWVIGHLSEVNRLVQEVRLRLEDEAKIVQRERFWSAAISCNVAACDIANRLGLIDIDPGTILKWATTELLHKLRIESVETTIDYSTVLGAFTTENGGNTLVVNENADSRAKDSPAPIKQPYGKIVCRWCPDAQKIYIHTKELRTFCSDNQYLLKDLIKYMDDRGDYLGRNRVSLTKGTDLPTSLVEAYVFRYSEDMMPGDLLTSPSENEPAQETIRP